MSTSFKPKVLYHYTSADGLIEILSSGHIWASSIHHLNDSQEFSLALKLAKGALLAEAESHKNPAARQMAESLIEQLTTRASFSIFVTCFSKSGDDLSQWRGYCPPGAGYSLGFDVDQLLQVARQEEFVLYKCTYDESQQKEVAKSWAQEAINTFIDSLKGKRDTEKEGPWHSGLSIEKWLNFAPFLKHHSFEKENEWRLAGVVAPKDPRVKVRAQGTIMVPYLPIDLRPRITNQDGSKPSTLSRIVVGPNPHTNLNRRAIEYVGSELSKDFPVHESMVPYRSW